jgi:hypothetical protein
MNDADRYKLLHGPYRTPPCKLGGRLYCQARGWVVVKRISTGPISWPQTIVKRSRTFILCGDLVKAVQRESEIAVAHWWGVTEGTVWKWRKALGVPRANEGSSRLWRDHFNEPDRLPAREKAWAKNGDPERCAKIAAARRGKPRPAYVREAIAWANRERVVSEETRRKMSEAARRRGARPPKAGRPWTAEEDALVREHPAAEVALRTGRTLSAVYDRRRQLGLPDGRAGRRIHRIHGERD